MAGVARITLVAVATCLLTVGCRQAPMTVDLTSAWDIVHREHKAAKGPHDPTPPGVPLDSPVPEPPLRIPFVSTVAAPEQPRRNITLAQCVTLALENGRTGAFFDRAGTDRRTSVAGLLRLSAPGVSTDSIRVVAYDPALLATEIQESLAKFDAVFQSSLVWNRTDRLGRGLGFVPDDRTDLVQFRTAILKPLATGGLAGITFRSEHEDNTLFPGVNNINPVYRSAADLTFEQPLLQGAGVCINRIRDTHPGGIRNFVPQGGRVPGILVAQAYFEQSRYEFERRVQELLFAVEEAYWDLHCAYWDLYSRDQALQLSQDLWQKAKARLEAGGATDDQLAQIETQFHLLRTQRLEALGNGSGGRMGVLEAERQLRYVVGLPPEDGTRLIPSDLPVTAPFEPCWEVAMDEALNRRPELLQVQEEILATRFLLLQAQDLQRPDLRFISKYNTNGLASSLGSSLGRAGAFGHHDWEFGLQLQVPIGVRAASAEVARVKLQLEQRLLFLRDQEAKVVLSLQRSYRSLVQYREEVKTRRSQREAAETQLRALYNRFKAGGGELIDILVRTQQVWADALREEKAAVCNYNVALADFERQKGTIPDSLNVTVASGPLPNGAHEPARSHHPAPKVANYEPGTWRAPQGPRPTSRPLLSLEVERGGGERAATP